MLTCPACDIPLCHVRYEGMPLHVCPDCGGTLVRRLRLGTIRRKQERTWTEAEKAELAARAAQNDRPLETRCPLCLQDMKKLLVRHGTVVFHPDRCDACDALWLDRGELELAQIVHEEERANLTEKELRDRERQALALIRIREGLVRDRPEDDPLQIVPTGAGLLAGPLGAAGAGVLATALGAVRERLQPDGYLDFGAMPRGAAAVAARRAEKAREDGPRPRRPQVAARADAPLPGMRTTWHDHLLTAALVALMVVAVVLLVLWLVYGP